MDAATDEAASGSEHEARSGEGPGFDGEGGDAGIGIQHGEMSQRHREAGHGHVEGKCESHCAPCGVFGFHGLYSPVLNRRSDSSG